MARTRRKGKGPAKEAPTGAAGPPGRNATGILLAILAVTVFAMQDGVTKHLATHYHAIFVVMLRYWAFGVFAAALFSFRRGGLRSVALSANAPLQFFRGMLLATEICIATWCFVEIGLIGTHVMFATFPLMVTVLSIPFLGEKVGWHRWLAVAAGFAGVMVILQPGSAEVSPALLIPLGATFMFAMYQVLTRYVSRTDSPETSFLWTGVGGVATLTVIGPFFWDPMQGIDWWWMLALSVMAASGHYLNIRALSMAEASSIQPFFYLQTVLVSAIAMVVFGEAFTREMLAGALIIVASGMYTFWREGLRSGGA